MIQKNSVKEEPLCLDGADSRPGACSAVGQTRQRPGRVPASYRPENAFNLSEPVAVSVDVSRSYPYKITTLGVDRPSGFAQASERLCWHFGQPVRVRKDALVPLAGGQGCGGSACLRRKWRLRVPDPAGVQAVPLRAISFDASRLTCRPDGRQTPALRGRLA